MGIVLKNNAKSVLMANISSLDTTIYVDDTSSFPALGVGDYFYCTIESTTGTYEIVKVTQVNLTNFIVERGQEDTIAVPFNIGARVEHRITVQSLEDQFDAATTEAAEDAIADAIGVTIQAYDPDLSTWSSLTPSANFQTLVPETFAQMRASLDLEAGTDFYSIAAADAAFQAKDADLTTWAGLTPSANFQTLVPHTFAQMRADLDLEAGTDFYSTTASDAKYAILASNPNFIGPGAAASLTLTAQNSAAAAALNVVAGDTNNSYLNFLNGTGQRARIYANDSRELNFDSGTLEMVIKNDGNVYVAWGIELGDYAGDTTLTRLSAGNVGVEGNLLYRAGGTDVPVTDGGTGASTAANARTNLGAAASGANTDITSVYLNNTGLKVKDTDASHGLSIVPGSNLTADRTLTVTTGDAARTLDISAGSVTVSSFGASLVDDADAATARSTLGLVIGTNVQAFDADLSTWATLTPSANFQTMVPHTFSQMRTDLGLVIGTDVQAQDAQLAAIAGTTPSAGDIHYWTSSTAVSPVTSTAAGRSILTYTDPNVDAVTFWDDSAGAFAGLTLPSTMSISGTSLRQDETWMIACSDETTALTTGTNKATFVFPYDVTVVSVGCSVNTAGTGLTVDINEATTSILSTKITLDSGEKTSLTAATAPVISDTTIAAGAEVGIDIDSVSGTAKGLKVWMVVRRTS